MISENEFSSTKKNDLVWAGWRGNGRLISEKESSNFSYYQKIPCPSAGWRGNGRLVSKIFLLVK